MSEEEFKRLKNIKVSPQSCHSVADLVPVKGIVAAMAEKAVKAKFEPLVASEHTEHAALVQWLRIKGIRHHATPNGARTSIGMAKKLKAEGMSAGFPDLTLWPPPDSSLPILMIELKRRKGGVVSEDQREWIAYFDKLCLSHNVKAAVCKGFDQAKEFIEAQGY